MEVSELMRSEPRVCSPGHTLTTAGRIMAEVGCGVLPVVSADLRVVGLVTDRDICTTLAIRDRGPSEVKVREALSHELVACLPDDSIARALDLMRSRRLRRLPVVNEEGALEGLLSLDDLAIAASNDDGPEAISFADVARTLQAICKPATPAPEPASQAGDAAV